MRTSAGLSAKSWAAAERGLAGTLFEVQVFCRHEPAGMGRVVGDGGCFFHVVDIAVLPEHRGKEIGRLIMSEIMKYIAANVPGTGYMSLIAGGGAENLYGRFGFVRTAFEPAAMALNPGGAKR